MLLSHVRFTNGIIVLRWLMIQRCVAYAPACENCLHLITDLCYLNTLILRLFEHFEDWFHLTENYFVPLEVQMG